MLHTKPLPNIWTTSRSLNSNPSLCDFISSFRARSSVLLSVSFGGLSRPRCGRNQFGARRPAGLPGGPSTVGRDQDAGTRRRELDGNIAGSRADGSSVGGGRRRDAAARQRSGHGSQVRVTGHRSEVRGHRAQVTGHRSQVRGHRAQVRGHRVTGHRSEVRGQRPQGTGHGLQLWLQDSPVTSQSTCCSAGRRYGTS